MPGPASVRRPRVVVAGGGIAGVEALLALRSLAGGRLKLELLAPESELVMRPLAVAAPFGTAEMKRYPLDPICADQDVHLRHDALEFVDVSARRFETLFGATIDYDALVLAVGARRRPALDGALTFDGAAGIEGFRALLHDLQSGRARSVAFVVPQGVTWPLPLYELALMTAERVRDRGVALTFVTPERHPLEVFGGPARERVRDLLEESGIVLRTGARALSVTNGMLLTSTGAIPADRFVALPVLEGPRLAGVPCDAHGFLEVDEHGAVVGAPGVYAAGDGTAGPIKQGGLATQQADAVAEAIAAAFGAPCEPVPFQPHLRAQLLTGTIPWWFRGGRDEDGAPLASRAALWSPPGKVAARFLSAYLAGRPHLAVSAEPELRDLAPPSGDVATDRSAAIDLALLLADDEAVGGEPAEAVRWLDAAEGLGGTLPPEYAAKRARWSGVAPERPLVREPGGVWG